MANTTTYLSGERIQGRSDDALLTAIPQTSWKELDRVTLGSSSAEVEVTGLTAKDNLMILVYSIGSNTNDAFISFNGDEGSNYANRYSRNGGSDSTDTSQGIGLRYEQGSTTPQFAVINVRNTASKEKLVIGHTVTQNSAGAGNVPERQEWVGKWANTSNAITQVTLDRASGTFDSGTELIVLGCDDDEADSGTNYWQELTVKELSSSGDTIDTGTFTTKKYLKVDVFIKSTTAVRTQFQFNSDTGSNYVNRNSKNGGTDSSNASMGRIYLNDLERSSDGYSVSYICNVASKEKLIWYEDIWQRTTGTGTEPDRVECVAKWANTSNQITSIQLLNDKAGDFLSGSFVRIWGSD